jgi:hypothetical protein
MYGANTARMIRSVKGPSNRQRMKMANFAIEHAQKVRLILLAVLAQSGGEVTVTNGTIQQVGSNLATLDYAIIDGKNPNESIVRLVEGQDDEHDTESAEPAVESAPAGGTEAPTESLSGDQPVGDGGSGVSEAGSGHRDATGGDASPASASD